MHLLQIYCKREHSCEVDLPFSRDELANYLAVDRASLSRALGELKKAGIIEFKNIDFSYSNEKLLQNIPVYLYNIKTNKLVSNANLYTDTTGKYQIDNVEKGEYLVLFDYDTSKYKLTTYKVKRIQENKNSDIMDEKITINGEDYQARITKNIGTQNDNLTIQITTSEEMKVIIDILKTSNEKYVMSYEVTGSGDTENKLLVNVNMDIKFNVDNTVEELTDENSVIINDMSIEEIEKIKETVVMLVKEKEGIEDTIIGFFQSIMQIKDEATSEAESAIEERASQESIGNVNIRPY